MMRIALTTLGCKLNQYETWQMTALLGYAEIVPFTEVADVYVVNTCTVTSRSDFRSRQLIRQAKRRNPSSKIIVTGCYAQTGREILENLEEVDVVMPNEDKKAILDVLNSFMTEKLESCESGDMSGFLADYTRAFVKIQDGCDNSCSYCIVRIARGSQRSELPEKIIQEVTSLCAKGYEEVVFTGIQLGGYGADLDVRMSLAGLLTSLADVKGLKRLRLSSIEPMDFTEELLDVLSGTPYICPHFHIPLQSGDDDILRSMNRSYTVDEYRNIILNLKDRCPQMGLGADVIVGFPGETDNQFENSLCLVEELPFSYIHVFSFSARPGTDAALMPRQVQPEIIKKRGNLLRALAARKKDAFQKNFVGEILSVLIEKKRDAAIGLLTGLSDNYLRVYTDGDENNMNQICQIRVDELTDGKLIGKIV